MDKSLKRAIGYVKNAESKVEVKKEKKVDKPPEIEKQPPKLTSTIKKESIVTWLAERPFINKSALCKEAGIDRANFDKYFKLGEFPERLEKKIVEQLKPYGY